MKKSQNMKVGKMEGFDWEMRPGGMLVQKRNLDSGKYSSKPVPTIKIYVKYGSSYHEIHINSHASFGELKKMLAGPTGLHPQDQKLIYKDKEKESRAFLDVCGVKDGSKIVVVQDIINQEKRFLESQRNLNIEKAYKSVAEVTMEVDKLVSKVTGMEIVISKGGVVNEKEMLTLIELLMSQLIKLDGIVADGDIKLKRKTQVVRIQKYIENLDSLKAQNITAMKKDDNGGQRRSLVVQPQRSFSSQQINPNTKWEKY